mgnify:CR=1 FL=1
MMALKNPHITWGFFTWEFLSSLANLANRSSISNESSKQSALFRSFAHEVQRRPHRHYDQPIR